MAAILLTGVELFEQVVNSLSKDGPIWNLVKIAQGNLDKKFKIYTMLYMYITQWQGNITPRGKNFDCSMQV